MSWKSSSIIATWSLSRTKRSSYIRLSGPKNSSSGVGSILPLAATRNLFATSSVNWTDWTSRLMSLTRPAVTSGGIRSRWSRNQASLDAG